MGSSTEVIVTESTDAAAASGAADGDNASDATAQHGHSSYTSLCAHARALLAPATSDDMSRAPQSASESPLAACALRGGHALLCGPPGNGKLRTLRRVGDYLRRKLRAPEATPRAVALQ